jgi:putative transposase
MKIPTSMLRLKGFRFPREIIAYAVWAYHRFAMSTADVEDLLAERGVIVSREAIPLWVNRFGQHFANCVRRDRPRPNDKWHRGLSSNGTENLHKVFMHHRHRRLMGHAMV